MEKRKGELREGRKERRKRRDKREERNEDEINRREWITKE